MVTVVVDTVKFSELLLNPKRLKIPAQDPRTGQCQHALYLSHYHQGRNSGLRPGNAHLHGEQRTTVNSPGQKGIRNLDTGAWNTVSDWLNKVFSKPTFLGLIPGPHLLITCFCHVLKHGNIVTTCSMSWLWNTMSWTQCLKTPKKTTAPVLQMIELNPGELGELCPRSNTVGRSGLRPRCVLSQRLGSYLDMG